MTRVTMRKKTSARSAEWVVLSPHITFILFASSSVLNPIPHSHAPAWEWGIKLWVDAARNTDPQQPHFVAFMALHCETGMPSHSGAGERGRLAHYCASF